MISGHERHMPRKSRIDAPGALHHIIARAIMGMLIIFFELYWTQFVPVYQNIWVQE
jgi:hypothetical protein